MVLAVVVPLVLAASARVVAIATLPLVPTTLPLLHNNPTPTLPPPRTAPMASRPTLLPLRLGESLPRNRTVAVGERRRPTQRQLLLPLGARRRRRLLGVQTRPSMVLLPPAPLYSQSLSHPDLLQRHPRRLRCLGLKLHGAFIFSLIWR